MSEVKRRSSYTRPSAVTSHGMHLAVPLADQARAGLQPDLRLGRLRVRVAAQHVQQALHGGREPAVRLLLEAVSQGAPEQRCGKIRCRLVEHRLPLGAQLGWRQRRQPRQLLVDARQSRRHRVAGLFAALALRDGVTLLAHAGERGAGGVRQPAGRLDQLRKRGTLLALEQRQEQRRLRRSALRGRAGAGVRSAEPPSAAPMSLRLNADGASPSVVDDDAEALIIVDPPCLVGDRHEIFINE